MKNNKGLLKNPGNSSNTKDIKNNGFLSPRIIEAHAYIVERGMLRLLGKGKEKK